MNNSVSLIDGHIDELNVTHEAKIYPEWYEGLLSGVKTFEVRRDDREPKYQSNDILFLREFDGTNYTGRTIRAKINMVLRNEYCKEGHCIMSVEVIDSYPKAPTTNYDWIKSKSIDEMASFLMCPAEYDLNFNHHSDCSGDMSRDCNKCIREWLESEVTE